MRSSAKRERLSQAGISVPAGIIFVSVDFERETILEALGRAHFDGAMPAFFAWLGVTPYLAREVVIATLKGIAKGVSVGSEIVFDFTTPPDDPRAKALQEALAAHLDAAGEPLKSAFDPGALTTEVRALGFRCVEVTDSAALNARYFDRRNDGLVLLGVHPADSRSPTRKAADPPIG
jgi:methyltransferase (TIGR00027 family)